jgi:uncharacterized membrane protein
MFDRGRVLLIAALVLLGVFFRFEGLDRKLLWHDEVYTRIFAAGYQGRDWLPALYTGEVFDVSEVQRFQHYDSTKTLADTVGGLAEDEPQHPPVYYALARIWMGWFGNGIGALRSLSALGSLIAIPGIAWLAWELFKDRWIAAYAAGLLAVSPFFVLYAQEAREYALWSACIVLSSAALLRAIRVGSVGAWALYAVLIAFGLYTAFSTSAVILAHILFIVVRERGVTRISLSSAAALAVAAVLFAPWAYVLWFHLDAFSAKMAWSQTIVIPRIELLSALAMNVSRPFVDGWADYDGVGSILAVAAACSLVGGSMVALARKERGEAALFVLCLAAVPIGMLLLPDLLFGGIRSLSGRYLTASWIGCELAVAYAIGKAIAADRRAAVLGVVAAIGVVSCTVNAGKVVVWTKVVSRALPEVAAEIPAGALVVGDHEGHNPGNLLALSGMLEPGTKMQLVDYPAVGMYELPEGWTGPVYAFSPTDQLRGRVGADELVVDDLHLQLWRRRSEHAIEGSAAMRPAQVERR